MDLNNWINVKDRLPENDKDVLAFVQYDECAITAFWNGKQWRSGSQARDYIECDGYKESVLHEYKVTHWQPLPPTPLTLSIKQ